MPTLWSQLIEATAECSIEATACLSVRPFEGLVEWLKGKALCGGEEMDALDQAAREQALGLVGCVSNRYEAEGRGSRDLPVTSRVDPTLVHRRLIGRRHEPHKDTSDLAQTAGVHPCGAGCRPSPADTRRSRHGPAPGRR